MTPVPSSYPELFPQLLMVGTCKQQWNWELAECLQKASHVIVAGVLLMISFATDRAQGETGVLSSSGRSIALSRGSFLVPISADAIQLLL
ncbi:hypothetical protein GQ43DRAFT_442554, partial [Delitschia confertaspora ATCC 74209]